MLSALRAATLCKLNWHCRKGKRIKKYDSGRLPRLCCYCDKIVAWGR